MWYFLRCSSCPARSDPHSLCALAFDSAGTGAGPERPALRDAADAAHDQVVSAGPGWVSHQRPVAHHPRPKVRLDTRLVYQILLIARSY